MTDLLLDSFFASCVGSGLSLDRKAAFQIMVSRPLVAATLIGFLLGNPTGGITAGIFFELLYIGDLPIGGYVPSHETAITVVSTAVALMCAGLLDITGPLYSLIALSALLVIPLGHAFNLGDKVARRYNVRYFHDAHVTVMDDYRVIIRKNMKGLAALFIATFTTILVTILAGTLIVSTLYHLLPNVVVVKLLPMVWVALVLLGFAATYNTAYSDKARLLFCAAVGLFAALFMTVWYGW